MKIRTSSATDTPLIRVLNPNSEVGQEINAENSVDCAAVRYNLNLLNFHYSVDFRFNLFQVT